MAYLVLMNEGQAATRFALDKIPLSIGRSPECDIYLEDPSVSFQHATLDTSPKDDSQDSEFEFCLKDVDSTNGTFVNNHKIEKVTLKHNDTIVIGLSNFKFIDETQGALEKTQQIKKSWFPGVFYLKDRS